MLSTIIYIFLPSSAVMPLGKGLIKKVWSLAQIFFKLWPFLLLICDIFSMLPFLGYNLSSYPLTLQFYYLLLKYMTTHIISITI